MTGDGLRAVGATSGLVAVVALVLAAGACSEPDPVDRAVVHAAVALAAAAPGPAEAVLCVDTARSRVRWVGTKIGGRHEGVVRLRGGRLRVLDGAVVGGRFTVDMRTIAVTDIPADQPEPRRILRSHLVHEEFFGVDRFPTARFVITGVDGGEHGRYTVSGNLAIRDSVHNVTFPASAPVVSADAVWATARFGIDRQLWGIDFDGRTSALRSAIVHDLIRLEVTLVATAGACDDGP